MNPTKPATTLNPDFYISDGTFVQELDKVFACTWQYVGHVDQIRSPGDYFVTEVAGESLLITRSADRQLNAFFNVCVHRASRVAQGTGNRQRFVCPNHGWCYDNKGKLVHANNAKNVPGMDIKNYSLTRCRIEELQGLIFVNLDSNCASLIENNADLVQDVKSSLPELADYQFAHRTELTLQANWKIAVENFSECYHCALVHKSFFSTGGSNQGGGVDADTYRIQTNGIWHRHYGKIYPDQQAANASNAQEEFIVWWLWPNFAVQKHPGNMVNVRQWVPVDVDKTYVYVDWYLPNAPTEQDKKTFSEHASGVFAEDVPIIELVHQGLKSRSYKGGPLMIDEASSVLSEHAVLAIQDLWRTYIR